MFAPRGRFIPSVTAGLARKSHNPSVTVARSRERLQRMFQVGIFWWGWPAVHLRGMVQDFFRGRPKDLGKALRSTYMRGDVLVVDSKQAGNRGEKRRQTSQDTG